MPNKDAFIYRFGVFELDLRAAELRKNGVKLRLQDQPYQVLLKLLEHHGEIVSREELRSILWHEDTFVDFETGLNTAIKRLRETLGDSADSPTFIETLPRRGYRFIATVERPVGEESGISGPSSPPESSAGKNLLKRTGVIAGVVVLVLICVAFWRSQPQPPTVTNIVRITNDGKAKNPINSPVTDGVHLYFTEGMPDDIRLRDRSSVGCRRRDHLDYNYTPGCLGRQSGLSRSLGAIGLESRQGRVGFRNPTLGATTAGRYAPPVGNISAILATWTPDGTHIVYADAGNDNDGEQRRKRTSSTGESFRPRVLHSVFAGWPADPL